MKKNLLAIVLFALFPVLSSLAAEKATGPLADYVAKPDANYGWKKRFEGKLGRTPYVELTLTSQKWRDIVWKHRLFILKPTTVTAETQHGLLFIAGGNWRPEYEQPVDDLILPREAKMFALIAEQMKTPVAVLLQVPQQPIFDGKVEDEIIAHTFDQYLKTGDTQWPLLLPMVKSAVRGMDAVQEYTSDRWKLDLKTFTVSGASKRGWTTWLTGAVDPRATAIAPIVIDMLNMKHQLAHQEQAWGELSYKINDYSKLDLPKRLQSNEGKALRQIVDPYSYRHLLTQPKLIMIGTNDHYWTLDALNLYWDDLLGEKHILYVPNNRHGLRDYGRVLGTLNALHQRAAHGKPLPKLSWKFTNGGKKLQLRLESDVKPQNVVAWIATSATRDFRKATWRSLPSQADGKAFLCNLEIPAEGFAAMFAEAVFDGGTLPYFLSTNVQIVSTKGGKSD